MPEKIKICIISSQIMGFGKIGGFGSMTKKLALSLVAEGYQVSVIVPRKGTQLEIETVDGIEIYGVTIKSLFRFKQLLRKIDADIYHSQNPNFFTFLAIRYEKQKKHVITCRDPRDTRDWLIETWHATWKRRFRTPFVYLFEDGPFIAYAVRKAAVVGCPAYFLIDKVARMYGQKDAILLPNIENLPDGVPEKSKEPCVCFVGRLDKRKRPEILFSLAGRFPDVKFIIAGAAEDKNRQAQLEKIAGRYNNIEMLGYVDKFSSQQLQEVYSKSWILLNTSAREGLPITFIEAASYSCAILSKVNPDEFASEFGYWAQKDDFEKGLGFLLSSDKWKEKGQKGFEYVKNIYNQEAAIKKHVDVYDFLTERH